MPQFRTDSRFLTQLFSSLNAYKFDPVDVNVGNYVIKFNKQQLSSLIRKNGLLRRAVYDFPMSAAVPWININYSKGVNKDSEDVLKYLDSIPYYTHAKQSVEGYGMRSAFKYASGLARKFGVAYLVLGVADGQDLKEPINTKKIKTIDWVKVYDGFQLTYTQTQQVPDVPGGNTYGIDFDYYRSPYNFLQIHPERVIPFYGNYLDTREEFFDSMYRHDPVITNMFEAFTSWLVANKAVSKLLVKSTAYKFAMQDLGDLIRQDTDTNTTTNQDYLRERAQSLDTGLNIADILWYDKEYEDLDTVSLSMGGVDTAIDKLKDALSAVSDMPRWRLFNEFGSSNLAASVQSAQMLRYQWAFNVNDWTVNNWLNQIYYLIKLCMSAKNLYGSVIDNFQEHSIEFPLNIQLSQTEQLEIEKLAAERSHILIQDGVLTPDEVRLQYSGTVFNPNITLDNKSFQEMKNSKLNQQSNIQDLVKNQDLIKNNDNPDNNIGSDNNDNGYAVI